MNILAIETSASVAGAAVMRGGKLVAECYQDHKLTHSQVILPLVERALSMAELNCPDMDAFAVDVGPGSFTGVRIGVCLANGMADALNRPVVSVDSLEAMAFGLPFFAGLVIPLVDARKDQVFAACFDVSAGEPKRVGERFAGGIHEFLERIPKGERAVFLGDGVARHKELLSAQFPKIEFAPAHANRPRAGAVAALAALRLGRGETGKAALPLYLRATQAERMRAQKERGDG